MNIGVENIWWLSPAIVVGGMLLMGLDVLIERLSRKESNDER
jgi:hypothetical protein